jgi:hypothetical protein
MKRRLAYRAPVMSLVLLLLVTGALPVSAARPAAPLPPGVKSYNTVSVGFPLRSCSLT